MKARKTILKFIYSEGIKSELIIVSQALAKKFTPNDAERIGAEKLMTTHLSASVGEIRIGQGLEKER